MFNHLPKKFTLLIASSLVFSSAALAGGLERESRTSSYTAAAAKLFISRRNISVDFVSFSLSGGRDSCYCTVLTTRAAYGSLAQCTALLTKTEASAK